MCEHHLNSHLDPDVFETNVTGRCVVSAVDPKKAKALRILALKVAAILEWDLDILEKE